MNYDDIKIGQKVNARAVNDSYHYDVGTVVQIDAANGIYPITIKTDLGSLVSFRPDELWLDADVISPATVETEKTTLPTDAAERKKYPIGTGVLDYFPAALAEVAKVSFQGNQQHNPGQPLHWARNKSTDQADTIIRHYLERGGIDIDGQRHSAKLAWRALALLQLELEAEGAPVARGASYNEEKK